MGLEVEEVNAVDVLQEGGGDHCRFGSFQERMADPKEECHEDKGDEDGVAEASGSPIHMEGDARLEFGRDGKKCSDGFHMETYSVRLSIIAAELGSLWVHAQIYQVFATPGRSRQDWQADVHIHVKEGETH